MGRERRAYFPSCDDVDTLYRDHADTAVSSNMEYRRTGDTGEQGACIPHFDVHVGDIEAADGGRTFFPDCVRNDREKPACMVSVCIYGSSVCGPYLLDGAPCAVLLLRLWKRRIPLRRCWRSLR